MSQLKSKVNAALEKIGFTNGTAPAESQDPIDAAAHEYNVASQMASYAEKRKDTAKVNLIDKLGDDALNKLSKAKVAVAKTSISDTITIATAANHIVTAKVNIGASYLDPKSLKVALMKKFTSAEVEKLFEEHTKRRDPSVTWVIGELGDG
jgi:hypothetical protein